MQKLQAELPGAVVDPLELLLRVSSDAGLPWDLRVDAAKGARKALYPDLQTTQISGLNDGPIEIQAAMLALMSDPTKAAAAEMLSIALSSPNAGRQLAAAPEDIRDADVIPSSTVPAENSPSV